MFSIKSWERDWSPEWRTRRIVEIKENIPKEPASGPRKINQSGLLRGFRSPHHQDRCKTGGQVPRRQGSQRRDSGQQVISDGFVVVEVEESVPSPLLWLVVRPVICGFGGSSIPIRAHHHGSEI